MKPYIFILQIDTEEDFKTDGIEQLKTRIRADGLNPDDFDFFQYGHIPDRFRDSSTAQFVGKRIIFTRAERKI